MEVTAIKASVQSGPRYSIGLKIGIAFGKHNA
jgi:hypothetical protein